MKARVILWMILVPTALSLFSGCATTPAPDWYTVTGSGVARPTDPLPQADLMARQAARRDAQRQILEAAKGVHIKSSSTVEDFMTRDDYIRSRVEGIIRDAQIVDTRNTSEGAWEVDMRIDMNRIRDIVR